MPPALHNAQSGSGIAMKWAFRQSKITIWHRIGSMHESRKMAGCCHIQDQLNETEPKSASNASMTNFKREPMLLA